MTAAPAAWLTSHAALLPLDGRALDVACGSGRNAIWLAERGLQTTAVDRDAEAIARLNAIARERRLPLSAHVQDLETGNASLGWRSYDVVVVTHYLHRPLFPALLGALRPGGVLVYETFTRAQAARGKPTNRAFLLEPAELRELVADLEILDWREGEFEEKMLSSVVGRAFRRMPAPSEPRRR